MKFLAGFLAAALVAAAAFAQSEARLAWSTNSLTLDTKSADACAPTVVERFSRYAVVRLDAQPARHALVVQRFEVGSGCFEGFEPARADVYAKPVDVRTGKVGEQALWSFVTEGIAGEVVYPAGAPLYRVDMPGCCGAAKTEKYYSLRTGKLVASSTGALLSVESPQERAARFVAVEDGIASSPQGTAGVMATVFLGDAEEAREILSIATDAKGERHGWSAQIKWKGSDAAGILAPGFSGATVELRLACLCDAPPVRIEIPLTAAGFDERAALVEGMAGIVLTRTRLGDGRAVSPLTPGAVTQELFDYLLRRGTDIATDGPAQRRWLAADLRLRLVDVAAAVKAARTHADGPQLVAPGNGVFLDSWDYPTQCHAQDGTAPAGTAAEVAVECEWGWGTNYAGVTRNGLVSLVREGGVWRVADIRMRKNRYSAETHLLGELDSLKRQAEEALRRPAEPDKP